VQVLPSVRMTANLNAVVRFQVSVAEAAVAVVGADLAHHVVDPDSVLGLDPLRATPLEPPRSWSCGCSRSRCPGRPDRCGGRPS
jgi:hypothetical protein